MQKQLLEKENNLGGLTMKKFLKQLLNKRLNNEKGLTLIELLAVIVILAIIAAIAVPAIGNIINNSEIKAVKADALNILNSANLYFTENPDVGTITYTNGTLTYTKDDDTTTYPSPAPNFGDFIQSYGSFEEATFTIDNNSGQLTLNTSTPISAGGKSIDFNDAAIDDINADNAGEDGAAVTVS